MLHPLATGTHLFRVTGAARKWLDVPSGTGSYYTAGGRYNRVQQRTVYAARHVEVAIAEAAFHQAMDQWQPRIGRGNLGTQVPLPPPTQRLVSEHKLWEFRIDADLQLVSVEDPAALAILNHRLYELLNPSTAYQTTATLADAVRLVAHPILPNAFVDGILAPSVRTPAAGGNVPRQEVLFVPPNQPAVPATFVRRWLMTLEFADAVGQGVNANTRDIDWSNPRFELRNNAAAALGFASAVWHQIAIKYD